MAYATLPTCVGPHSWQHRRAAIAETTNELWARYLADRHPADRTALTESYLSLVGFVVSRLKGLLPRHVERDRLTQLGVFGLIDAIERFDPSRHVQFETFAVPRIRGAILDAVRAADWAPRSVRERQRALADAVTHLEARLMRAPTSEELREELGLTPAAFRALTVEAAHREIAALDEQVLELAGVSEDPADAVERAEETRLLHKTIASLPEREQQVLVMYYFQGLTLKQIGARLGVTESRVCKVLAKAMRAARDQLHHAG